MFNELFNAINTYKAAAKAQYPIHAETLAKIENTYTPAVALKLRDEENRNFAKSLEVPREKAKAEISRQIGKARHYIEHQLSCIDCKAINEIQSLQGLILGGAEIAALQQKYNGSFWTQKALNSVLNDLLPPTAQIPDISPDATLALLDKMENELSFAIDYYDGRETLDSSVESVACERVLSGISFGDYAADLNKNPVFTEQQIESFYTPLTLEEDRQIYKKYFMDCDTDEAKRSQAAKIVELGHGEMLERSGRFSKYLPDDYERVTGVCEVE